MAGKLLYLVRHGEHDDPGTEIDDGILTETGRQQSRLLGERLRQVPFSAIYHSPFRRAVQTAELIAEFLPSVPRYSEELLGDCIPLEPERSVLPPPFAEFLDRLPREALIKGPPQAAKAVERFAQAPEGEPERHELLVTHNFLIGWFVCQALQMPSWRWLGLNQFNCGLTILLYRPGRPGALVSYNDIGHLPLTLRGRSPLALRS
jgi:broad specificity phosphatase PhoE